MGYDVILIRYGELALKGKNRSDFEDRLLRNIRNKLKDFPDVKVKKTYGRMLVELNGQAHPPVVERLQEVFGVVGVSPAKRVPTELQALQQAAVALICERQTRPATFKIAAKRSIKSFPYKSMELNHLIGGYVLKNVDGIKVDVHHPELTVHVEVRAEAAYVYGDDIPGPGGLPVGASGRVALLLSGGIDSPVAGYLALKRGAELQAIHFHSYPFTSERAKQKVIDLAQILTRYGGKIRLHVVPFTEIQTQIRQKCEESYSVTVMRRMMFRIAERIAHKEKALALVTGENLGQVASQTLESMYTINHVIRMPVLRPVVGMDKQEIMNIAKRIGTYETSILPYEDCCTVFLPKSPKTRPDLNTTERMESHLDVDRLVQEAVDATEVLDLSPDKREEEFTFF
ncbi:tRNA uracil 4-sulfurtransferase ThiI [Polycladomyces subterraneus]|uniref:Probable tRNA sulfurtransferase n=1 Tax=Polycladomyces subterraneus TaxID=1016997 RepID=A0ABT8IQ34_9BACL|nr:tRNA uracil 4-sulfurtransferase ThiI [Polycladomyces subterraneus]MDN4594874.1 tRNA 4-thiouridine(8) synthase ThiI [Polycladomyces subterraneus]